MKGLVYSLLLIILIILLFEGCGRTYEPTQKIQLPSVFSENMVLQAGKEIQIWGQIDPITEVIPDIVFTPLCSEITFAVLPFNV